MERARFLGLCGLGYSLLRAQVGSTFVVKSLAGSRFVFSQNEQRPQNGVRSAFLSSFGETFPVRVDCSLKPISLSAAADGGGCERRRPPAESRGGGQGPETHQIGNEQSVMGISFSKSTATGGFSGCKLGWRRSPWQQRASRRGNTLVAKRHAESGREREETRSISAGRQAAPSSFCREGAELCK
ncbi:uncharacterized protein LOC119117121 isoform X7 [Syngnathus acus]|uniref:uncharacterized protein LOC119117121 isoform X7 n=1 Tax=Syngnathus acus TaxID=161584 RepID=UPI001885E4B9|nr:uncharacterized protein LOC119117121 isoform X7 [Syngnathus acus]